MGSDHGALDPWGRGSWGLEGAASPRSGRMTARSLWYTSASPRRFTTGPHLRRTARLAVVEPRRGSAVATRKGVRGMTNKRFSGRRSLHAAALATIAGLCVATVIGAGRA